MSRNLMSVVGWLFVILVCALIHLAYPSYTPSRTSIVFAIGFICGGIFAVIQSRLPR